MIEIFHNSKYDSEKIPKVSVITSVYNRREILTRAMLSVECQTFKDIEYVVVNNGSSINIDDVVEDFMAKATIQVVYIKRDHGIGPHTGKNSAIKEARGKYLVMLDSDDELLPNAIETLYKAWMKIPEDQRDEYREVVARCIDEYDNVIGESFPESINQMTKKATYKFWHQSGYAVERVTMDRTDYLKDYPFPEPEGVTWVVDSMILWDRLSKRYKSYFINDCLKRYYVGSEDSISNTEIRKVSEQHICNLLYAYKFKLNHHQEYYTSKTSTYQDIMRYNIYAHIMAKSKRFKFDWMAKPLEKTPIKIISALLWVPCLPIAYYFKKKEKWETNEGSCAKVRG